MTNDSKREELIEEAAKALTELTDAEWEIATAEGTDHLAGYFEAAARCLAVFEKAHAPTDDEREALCDQCGEVFSEHSCRPILSCIHLPEPPADLCEWCDMSARGNALHPGHDRPRRSCGEQYHGEGFEPDVEPQGEPTEAALDAWFLTRHRSLKASMAAAWRAAGEVKVDVSLEPDTIYHARVGGGDSVALRSAPSEEPEWEHGVEIHGGARWEWTVWESIDEARQMFPDLNFRESKRRAPGVAMPVEQDTENGSQR